MTAVTSSATRSGAPVTPAPERKPRARHKMPLQRRLTIYAARFALVGAVLGIWEASAANGVVDPFFTSQPTEIGSTLINLVGTSELWHNVYATASATVIGFVIGSIAGITLGLAIGSSDFLDRVTSPLLAIGNGMPRVAFAPLFVLWFGLTMWAKVVLAVSLVLFILTYNTRAALRTVDIDHVVIARMLDMSRVERFRKVTLPTCIPPIMAGLRLGVVFALLGVVASEMISAKDGLGQLVVLASTSFRVDRLMALILVIAAVAVILNALLDVVERRAIRWKVEGEE